jgi:hypothetical protein
MKEMIKKYEADRQKLIDDSNSDYVKGLQQQTDPNNPERKKMLDFWNKTKISKNKFKILFKKDSK